MTDDEMKRLLDANAAENRRYFNETVDRLSAENRHYFDVATEATKDPSDSSPRKSRLPIRG